MAQFTTTGILMEMLMSRGTAAVYEKAGCIWRCLWHSVNMLLKHVKRGRQGHYRGEIVLLGSLGCAWMSRLSDCVWMLMIGWKAYLLRLLLSCNLLLLLLGTEHGIESSDRESLFLFLERRRFLGILTLICVERILACGLVFQPVFVWQAFVSDRATVLLRIWLERRIILVLAYRLIRLQTISRLS